MNDKNSSFFYNLAVIFLWSGIIIGVIAGIILGDFSSYYKEFAWQVAINFWVWFGIASAAFYWMSIIIQKLNKIISIFDVKEEKEETISEDL